MRRFSCYLFLTSIVLFAILVISGAFGILQKFKSVHIQSEDFWLLILLKLPYLFNEISFIIHATYITDRSLSLCMFKNA